MAEGMEELKHELEKAHERAIEEELDPTEQATADLVRELLDKTRMLARKELELARVELKADIKEELSTAKGLAVGGVLALCGLNMLFVCGAFALATVIEGWLAALLVAAALLLCAGGVGLWGWSRRVTKPMETTRRTLEEDVEWAKRRLA